MEDIQRENDNHSSEEIHIIRNLIGTPNEKVGRLTHGLKSPPTESTKGGAHFMNVVEHHEDD